MLALAQQIFEQVADVFGDGLGHGVSLVACAGERVERTLKRLHERDVKVDAHNANGVAVVIANEDGRRLEQLAVGGLGEVRRVVVDLGGILVHRLEHNMAGPVAQFASADVAVFNRHDRVVRVPGLQIVDDDFTVGTKLERQTVCKALVKLNLCGGHGCLPKN